MVKGGAISSAASSDINSQLATPFQTKRVFIKGNDGSGTGGGAGGSLLANSKALIIKGSRLTIEQLENKITEIKEDLNKYVQDLSEDLIKIRDYCFNNTQGLEERLQAQLNENQVGMAALYI